MIVQNNSTYHCYQYLTKTLANGDQITTCMDEGPSILAIIIIFYLLIQIIACLPIGIIEGCESQIKIDFKPKLKHYILFPFYFIGFAIAEWIKK